MSTPYDWRINDIERKADRAYGRLYELDTLRSDVASLERALGELSSTCAWLRSEFQAMQERTIWLESRLDTQASEN
jgi:hypothetical protein